MEDKTITLSEAELQERIDSAVQAKAEELEKEHSKAMYAARQKFDKDLQKAKLSADDQAKLEAEEKSKEFQDELNDLRAYKKSTELEKRLTKEGLPAHYKYDTRLLSADDEQFEKVLKGVKSEYEATLPKGNAHSSVVKVASTQPQVDSKQDAYNKMGEALKGILN